MGRSSKMGALVLAGLRSS